MRNLQDGYADKVEQDRIEEVKKRGSDLHYGYISAFEVTDPALQHLIKKSLCAGLRGHKDTEQDLHDIIDSGHKALKFFKDTQQLEQES